MTYTTSDHQNILDWYHKASREDIAEGLTWYQSAHLDCQRLAIEYSLPLPVVVATVACLSPGCNWDINLLEAENVFCLVLYGQPLDDYGTRVYKRNLYKAWDIVSNQDITLLSGLKVTNFFNNILLPNETDNVTVDSWAARIWANEPGWNLSITPKRYRTIANDYRIAANELNLLPSQLQAIAWVTIRKVYSNRRIVSQHKKDFTRRYKSGDIKC